MWCQHRRQHFRALAQQHGQPVARLRLGYFQQRDIGLDRLQAARLLCTSSSLPAPSSQRASVSFCVSRRFSNVWATAMRFCATQFEVVARHFSGNQHLRVGQVGLLGVQVGARLQHGACGRTDPAPSRRRSRAGSFH